MKLTKHAIWSEAFENSIYAILSKINAYEKELSDSTIKKLASYSKQYLKLDPASPEQILFRYSRSASYPADTKKSAPSRRAKKILFVTGLFPGVKHGGGLRVFDMMEEMAIKGHEVWLYTPPPGPGEENEVAVVKKFVKKIFITPPVELSELSFLSLGNSSHLLE